MGSPMDDISCGKEVLPIPATDASFEPFEYVTKNIIPTPLATPYYDGCTCLHSCSSSASSTETECGCLLAHGAAYDRNRLTDRLTHPHAIYECNTRCTCPPTCANRLVQTGVTLPLQVFRTAGRGWGVRVQDRVARGAFVVEYVGEVVGTREAGRRWRGRRARGNYLLCLREHAETMIYRTNIDPTRKGNVARFINHSCAPNLVVVPVRVDTMIPSAALFAACDIEAGSELTFHYGGEGGAVQDEGAGAGEEGGDRIPCVCGSEACCGYLPFDAGLE
ncbi:histone-lysine N-methyltransferase SETMAR-like protein [Fimicolochytrium jonesii]|uniref:histone-lysine N-methyltransferase SETMAR-like protein n=1 Tax=Fimicolochytrium jonesii TaxID=1396493 RepID=UPI0022FDBAED|nr:histone-lysine N-methyltransferase SETMAR-like protein [Fimicolochytrium jonesii]KAI8815730.1 histone-lysine N-methyltransferase SETMAR-like protein [Fimicolochytrium jonesii]